jgi:hypothetical protein
MPRKLGRAEAPRLHQKRTQQPSTIALAFVPKLGGVNAIESWNCVAIHSIRYFAVRSCLPETNKTQHVRSDGLVQLRHVHGAGTA